MVLGGRNTTGANQMDVLDHRRTGIAADSDSSGELMSHR